jgi:hypothetical protein
MVDRSNSEKTTQHLEHGTSRRRGRIERLLMQVQIASRTIDLLEEADQVLQRSAEAAVGRITDSLEIFSDRYLAIGLLCR